MIQLILVTIMAYYYCFIITCMVYLFRRGLETKNAKEMQLLQERAANLEKRVMKYEHENRELKSELYTLVSAYA